jgi:hypothetical protein
VTELGGTPVRDAADLHVRLALLRIGEVAEFTVSRPGGMLTVRWNATRFLPSPTGSSLTTGMLDTARNACGTVTVSAMLALKAMRRSLSSCLDTSPPLSCRVLCKMPNEAQSHLMINAQHLGHLLGKVGIALFQVISHFCAASLVLAEDLAHRALRQIGEAWVSLCRSVLASVAGQKWR